jgi:hypothetical protein
MDCHPDLRINFLVLKALQKHKQTKAYSMQEVLLSAASSSFLL